MMDTIETLLKNIDTKEVKRARKNAGELGRQIELLVLQMIRYPIDSEKRLSYIFIVQDCLSELRNEREYENNTYKIYKTLYTEGYLHLDYDK